MLRGPFERWFLILADDCLYTTKQIATDSSIDIWCRVSLGLAGVRLNIF